MAYNEKNHARIIGILNSIVAKHQSLPHSPGGDPDGSMAGPAHALDLELLALEKELAAIRFEMAAQAVQAGTPVAYSTRNIAKPIAPPMVYAGC